jgi:hypothetical protein
MRKPLEFASHPVKLVKVLSSHICFESGLAHPTRDHHLLGLQAKGRRGNVQDRFAYVFSWHDLGVDVQNWRVGRKLWRVGRQHHRPPAIRITVKVFENVEQ